MSDVLKRTLGTGLAGVLSAILVDVHAWQKSGGRFDWKLGSKRWLAGLSTGLIAGLGIGL